MFKDYSLTAFVQALGAKEPTPGGGGAAALAGALGSALETMVCHFSMGKKAFIGKEAQHQALIDKGEVLSQRLLALVDEDAAQFEPLSKVYGMPRDTEEARAAKAQAMAVALDNAIQPPMKVLELALESLKLHEEALPIASKTIVSDIGCGAYLLEAAMKSAYLNVCINAGSMDPEKGAAYMAQAQALLKEGTALAQELGAAVLEKLV